MRDGRHILNADDLETGSLKRADGGLTSRTRAFDKYLYVFESMH